jgi:hypothetical protein
MKRTPSPAAVHFSICWSPSEFPKARIGRRPMNRLMPTGFAHELDAAARGDEGLDAAGAEVGEELQHDRR